MKESDFFKTIKDKMENYGETPDASSWNSIQSELTAGRRKVIWMRSVRIVASAAAAIALFLIVGKDSIWRSIDPSLKVEIVTQESIPTYQPDKQVLAQVEPQITIQTHKASRVKVSSKINVDEQKDNVADSKQQVQEQESPQLPSQQTEQQVKQKSYTQSGTQLWDQEEERSTNRRFKLGKPSLAFSTTVSPATGSVERVLKNHAYSSFNELSSSMERDQSDIETLYDTRYLPPVSLGLQVSVPLTKSFFAVTGLNYTMLYSITEERSFSQTTKREQSLHYIGIPLYLYANIIKSKNFSVYGGIGGAVEKGVVERLKLRGPIPYESSKSIGGYQWSAGVAVGAEYLLGNNIGLYADPMLTYYFYSYQPKSIRTTEPLQFKLEIGLRYRF
jgi:hypothetical protein